MAPTKARKPQAPQRRRANPRGTTGDSSKRRIWIGLGAAIIVVALAASYVALTRTGSTTSSSSGGAGLPNTSDYHSLLVSPTDPATLLLGTHQGIYRSTDGGRHWTSYRLGGQDAMTLARPHGNGAIWMAGHQVFATSNDGGKSWKPLAPSSLPSLDLHGFAVDPRKPSTLYAAVAGVGLFRSRDSAATFKQVSSEVGGNVMALAVTSAGEILAGDMERGLLASRDAGLSWKEALNAQLAGLAINPSNPKQILATGPGIIRSTDGGLHWKQVARLDAGAGPVAWSPSKSRVAYVVGFDRVLYRSNDAGASWAPVR
jgi:photosystem II stability/assembly factor-like uncharacterized protein